MTMNIQFRGRLFQVIWWGVNWRVRYWRWPPLEERKRIEVFNPGEGSAFGFHGLLIGPVEFRFHPYQTRRVR